MSSLARRGDAAALVAAAGYQDLIPAGGDAMVDRGAPIRQEAILALGRLGRQCGTEAVQAALSDPADAVRMAAIRVLFARQAATPLAAALAWLPPAEYGQSRALAVTALRELRRPECAPALAAALLRAPGDNSVRDDEAALLKLLIEAETESDIAREVVEALLVTLEDERDPVIDRAEELLVLLAPLSTEALIFALEGGPVPHRAAAVLAQIKDTSALKPLMDGLLHRDPRVRAECAVALGELRDPAAVEALIHASRDPEHRVRAQAAWALDRLGTVAVVIGVATMVRPMIVDGVAGAKSRPALGEPHIASPGDNGSSPYSDADADGRLAEPPSDPASPERLERLLARMDDVGDEGKF